MADDAQACRVVVIGAGIAGLSAALRLAPRPVILVSPETLGKGASSAWAQGGVAAAMDPADSPEAHAADTLRAGAGLVDAGVAHTITRAAPAAIRLLETIGARFDRSPAGGYVLSREAAHGARRVVRVGGDRAGAEIMRALVAAVRNTPSVRVLEGVAALSLALRGGRVAGVWLAPADGSGRAPLLLGARAVLLAAGGAGGLYARTTNPARISGQALGMAARAGAVIADAEFVQFHPTAIDIAADPLPLATEALRGEGAVLIDRTGARFMPALDPRAELAPRDIVARGVAACERAGGRPMLDTRACLGPRIATLFPAVHAACLGAGIDPVRQPIPVTAAAHYHMGGIATDARGQSSLPWLWAAGEAASTGLHGANRLASNGLLEALVMAGAAADAIAAELDQQTRGPAPPAPDPGLETALARLRGAAGGRTGAPPPEQAPDPAPPDPVLVARLRRAMSQGAGVTRDAAGLAACLHEIAAIEAAAGTNAAMANMTATARLIATAALARRESRGAHFRADFPEPAGARGHRSRLTLAQARATHPTLQETP